VSVDYKTGERRDYKRNITTEGKRHLGPVVGSRSYLNEYVNEKVEEWMKEIINLADFAITQPQVSYVVYTFGLKHRWFKICWITSMVQDLFKIIHRSRSVATIRRSDYKIPPASFG
jgi:hypothetical protein